jgi:GT2 family glycosyltransferase
LGGFDEGFWFWYEDVDLSRRLNERGELLNVPSAVFEHLGGGTFGGWNRAMNAASLLHGMARYADKHFSRAEAACFGVVLLLHSGPRAIVFGGELKLVHKSAVRAAVDLIRGRPTRTIVAPR